MGIKLSKSHSVVKSAKMDNSSREQSCQCFSTASTSSSTCAFCQPSTSSSEQNGDEVVNSSSTLESDIGLRRTFRNLSLGCRKRTKSKEKSEKGAGKTKLSWTLRWRMKSTQETELRQPMIDLARFNPADYPIEDTDELARLERAREIAEGIEMEIDSLPPSYRLRTDSSTEATESQPEAEAGAKDEAVSVPPPEEPVVAVQANPHVAILDGLTVLLHRSLAISIDSQRVWNVLSQLDLHFLAQHYHWHQHGPQGMFTLTPRIADRSLLDMPDIEADGHGMELLRPAHTQVDYLHCLVPDLLDITRCSFYWGKMDRYEAERLLDGKNDGTFLLRDSAQEEYLFSVSFRRYNRSLHARIEQWNHRFSFDSHDPGVYSSPTILGLIDHYKNPELCMFFEPTLTIPLHRNFPFTLQHLCRAVICSNVTYDGVNALNLPKSLKLYLKEYHYKQRIRVRRLDG